MSVFDNRFEEIFSTIVGQIQRSLMIEPSINCVWASLQKAEFSLIQHSVERFLKMCCPYVKGRCILIAHSSAQKTVVKTGIDLLFIHQARKLCVFIISHTHTVTRIICSLPRHIRSFESRLLHQTSTKNVWW